MGVVHLGARPQRPGRGASRCCARTSPTTRTPGPGWPARCDTLGRVQDRGVAAVLDADLDGDRPYVVTRYVPGPPLDEVVAETRPAARRTTCSGSAGAWPQALHAIHAAGVVHRDLKPGNVLMLDGDPVVIDFGIAHVADDVRLTMTGPGDGHARATSRPRWSRARRSPRRPTGGAGRPRWPSPRRGAPPFGRGPMDVVLDRVSRGDADLSGVDPRLAPLLHAALSPDPRRAPDADEVVDALERYAAGRPVTEALPASARGIPSRSPAPSRSGTDRRWGRSRLPVDHEPWAVARPGRPRRACSTPGTQPDDEVSDWQAAWEGGPGEPDPRIGRPKRTGTPLALLLALVVAVAADPARGCRRARAGLVAGLARTADRSVTSLVLRRHTTGRRRSDVPLAVAASPWHLRRRRAGHASSGCLAAAASVGVSCASSALRSRPWRSPGVSPAAECCGPAGGRRAAGAARAHGGARAARRCAAARAASCGEWCRAGPHEVVAGALWSAAGLGTWCVRPARRCGGRGRSRAVGGRWPAMASPQGASGACGTVGGLRRVDDRPAGRPTRPAGPQGGLRRPPVPRADLARRGAHRDAADGRVAAAHALPQPPGPQAAAEEREARASLDLALRVGELMLRCGAGAPQVESRVIAVAAAAGLDNLEVDITLQSLLVQCTTAVGRADHHAARRALGDPGLRPARRRSTSSSRTSWPAATTARRRPPGCARSAGRRGSGPGGRCAARWACSRPAVAIMLGAGLVAALVAGGSALLVGYAARVARARWPARTSTSAPIGGFLATIIAWGAFSLGAQRVAAGDARRSSPSSSPAASRCCCPGAPSPPRSRTPSPGYSVTGAGRHVRGVPHHGRDHPRRRHRPVPDAWRSTTAVRPGAGLPVDHGDRGP